MDQGWDGHGDMVEEALKSRTYPTNSLRFLQQRDVTKMNGCRTEYERHSKVLLKVIVIGAGIGGLATAVALRRRGHDVTVLEQADQLAEVGAGIQVPPNSSRQDPGQCLIYVGDLLISSIRILLDWGLGPFLKNGVVEPDAMRFRRWQNGEVIACTHLIPDFQKNFGAPYYVVHRAHLHDALHQLAVSLKVKVILGAKVSEYDEEGVSVTLPDGQRHYSDLLVAADGLNSVARKLVLGEEAPAVNCGFAAYRATVDTGKMKEDPQLAWLVGKPTLNCWIGDGQHVMSYTIAGGDTFNMVLSHRDHSDPSTWDQAHAVENAKQAFRGWDPRLVKIINMIDKTMKWPLLTGQSLDRWVSDSRRLLILGDAAHAMVPYMSQGAAMAVEDGAALAETLHQMDAEEQLGNALKIFESVRIKRTRGMQTASLVNGKLWHFPDGPEQEARDAAMRPEVDGKPFAISSNQWSDPVTQWWAYGYDAEQEIRNAWRS